MHKGDLPADPRGLIYEAYRMELSSAECRTIFFDWLMGLEADARPETIQTLLDHYGRAHPGHPMTRVLREGLESTSAPPKRRGGARTRRP